MTQDILMGQDFTSSREFEGSVIYEPIPDLSLNPGFLYGIAAVKYAQESLHM